MVEAIFAAVASAIAQLFGQQTIQEVSVRLGAKAKKELKETIANLAAKIQSDTELYQKFMSGSSEKKSNILSSIYQTMGFGPAVDQLRKAYADAEAKEKRATTQHIEYNKQLNKKYTTLSSIDAENQGLIAGGLAAYDYENSDLKKEVDSNLVYQPKYDVDNLVKGGIKDA